MASDSDSYLGEKADLQPDSDADPNQIAVDETVIYVDGQRHWLYAAVDPDTNQFIRVGLFQTRTRPFVVLFLRRLREKQQIKDVTFLVDDATYLTAALDRLGLRFQVYRHGDRNSIERIFREVKRLTSSFSNTFPNATLPTVESWLQAFTVWWNRYQTYMTWLYRSRICEQNYQQTSCSATSSSGRREERE